MVESIGNGRAQYTRQNHFYVERMAGSVAVWGKSSGTSLSVPQSDALNLSVPNSTSTNTTPPTFSFGEFLDIINPLQHIPVVGSIYRNFTGDTMSPVARIVGGTIFGGPLGGLASIAAAAIEEHSGENVASALAHSAYGESSHPTYVIAKEQRTAGGQSPSVEKSIDIASLSPDPSKQVWNLNS